MPKNSYYLSTPIYYVNSIPHLGTAYTTVAADTLARFRRMCGDDVLFLTGIDEHGQKVEEAATAHGTTPKEWCDSLAVKFQEVWSLLNISNDMFMRTTDAFHEATVQALATKLYESGDIYKGTYEGWYCVPDETYWNASDIDETHICPGCGRELKFVEEENYFFRLASYQERLLKYYEEHPDFIGPDSRLNEVLSFVKGGLNDLSISRSNVKWGIELPWDKTHTMYVWFDALINYLSAVGYGQEGREETFAYRWPAQIHFIGKDIIRFHCVIWPAMLMAAGIELPERVFAHGFLLTKGEKMSKSKGNAQTPASLVERFGVDGYRYYFMRDVSFGQDGSISLESMVQRYNGDLANDWGNLCSRLFNMVGKYFSGLVPDASDCADENEGVELKGIAATLFEKYEARMDKLDYAGALEETWELIKATNRYIEMSAPWALAKDEAHLPRLKAVIYNALEAVRIAALYTAPVMPATSAQVWKRMGLGDISSVDDIESCSSWGLLPAGNAVEKGEPLFPRIIEE
ncbi:MAG: methionine--tRNA ligase [Coriobacteriia bacterium]|nr:methionine--tRNA ligase [Coriobacteriia bacterium]